MPAPKRPNYFQSQFLVVSDFEDEQAYHEEMLRRHNRLMHEWGVVHDGLQVTRPGDNVMISPGAAIDSLGREIVLETPRTLSPGELTAARQAAGGNDVWITIAFNEVNSDDAADKYPPPGGSENVTRKVQSPTIAATKELTDPAVLVLAKLAADGTVDNSVRKLASSFVRGSGSNDLYISPEGKVGIGTMTPGAGKLSIGGTPYEGTLMDFVVAQYKLSLGYRSFESDTVSYHFDLKNNTGEFKKFLMFHKGNVEIANDLEVKGALSVARVNTSDIKLRKDDVNHGIGYFGEGAAEEVGDLAIDGPVVYGFHGGALGYWRGSKKTDKTVALRWTDEGKVGIGTSDPKATLQVGKEGSEGAPSLRIGWGAGNNEDKLTIHHSDTFKMGLRRGSRDLKIFAKSPDGDGHIYLMPNDTAAMSLLSNGNVGIGTLEPNVKLHVHGGADTALVIGDRALAGSVGLQFRGSGYKHAALRFDGDNVIIEDASNTSLPSKWYNANSPMNFIVRNGKVGIGTTEPLAKLHVVGNAQVAGDIVMSSTGEGRTLSSGGRMHLMGEELLYLLNKSGVIVGKEWGGNGNLSVQGNVQVNGGIGCGGRIGLKSSQWNRYLSARQESDGWVVRTVNVFQAFEQFTLEMACSREFKENISDVTASEAMTTLQNLTPVKYDYKGEKAFRQNLGFVAEDMPGNLASEDRKSISPFEVVPILTKVAKEQQRVIAKLEQIVRALQEDVKRRRNDL